MELEMWKGQGGWSSQIRISRTKNMETDGEKLREREREKEREKFKDL